MFESIIKKKFEEAGVGFRGDLPCDIRILPGQEARFFTRVALLSSLGLGKSYFDGTIQCKDVAKMLRRVMSYLHERRISKPSRFGGHIPSSLPEAWIKFQLNVLRRDAQSIAASAAAIAHHYDHTKFYDVVLGPTKIYSCGFFFGTDDNDQAQVVKYLHTASKLGLRPGMQCIEIGCGWGHGVAHVARKHPGVTFHCFTIAKEQYEHALKAHADLIAEGRLKFYLADFRKIPELFPEGFFDAGFSIGMFEHVGPRHHKEYGRIVRYCVKKHRPFVLHTIVGTGGIDPYIWYHIFPGGILPTGIQIEKMFAREHLVRMHRENLGKHYAKTLHGWRAKLHANWQKLRAMGYTERFLRMYDFYFAGCEIGFELGNIQLEQHTVAFDGMLNGFEWHAEQHVRHAA